VSDTGSTLAPIMETEETDSESLIGTYVKNRKVSRIQPTAQES